MTAPETPAGINLAHRSPAHAALLSGLFLGAGQIYNRQLEKAVLLWIWAAVQLGSGLLLLLMGLLGTWVPTTAVRPPLGDFIADRAGTVLLCWLAAGILLWGLGVRDAWTSAAAINRGEVVIRYPLQRQAVHLLASHLLGFIPFVGFFFPPGVVAEAIDAAHGKRRPDHRALLREGGQALAEWAARQAAVWGLGVFALVWAGWWILRLLHIAP
jgi:hypothetical protein